jgi:hypothetical protein
MYNNASHISQDRETKIVTFSMHNHPKNFTVTKFLIKQKNAMAYRCLRRYLRVTSNNNSKIIKIKGGGQKYSNPLI